MHGQPITSGWDQFMAILTKPDNIPIAGLMVILFYFTWLCFREARRNDELIAQGRKDEVLRDMQR